MPPAAELELPSFDHTDGPCAARATGRPCPSCPATTGGWRPARLLTFGAGIHYCVCVNLERSN
ncbi:MAG: hypothetical protein JOZ95_18090 [Solirubrobacterales bacterium]|nr:hypothetical protein [Solirubrobacterales bacterium]MBV9364188.1 hypothetical protein [Solirubrobacterales bacterium]